MTCTKPNAEGTIEIVKYLYDNETSEIFDHDLNPVQVKPIIEKDYLDVANSKKTSELTPVGKSNIKKLKIQLGLSCNYSCEYCSQRFVPNIDHSNTKHIDSFLDQLDTWLPEAPQEIEFWGGEPFVYWKILKPLAEKLAEKYLYTQFKIVTNGSLITEEIIDWLDELDFQVGISHDGPGQVVRGPDPLDDPKQRSILLKLFQRLSNRNRISFNAMLHRESFDRSKIQIFFEDLLGKDADFRIGEGGFVDVYDEGGLKNSLQTKEEHLAFRRLAFKDIREAKVSKFNATAMRFGEWVDSFANKRPSRILGQKCGMDEEDTIAVDLLGNVLTCQNTTYNAKAPNGKSHKIGHVRALDKVRLNTATHWSFRNECNSCPVLQVCKGSCMFLQDHYFKVSCDNAFSDHIPFFAAAFEHATGSLLQYIEAVDYDLPEDRRNIWGIGFTDTTPETRKQARPLNKDLEII